MVTLSCPSGDGKIVGSLFVPTRAQKYSLPSRPSPTTHSSAPAAGRQAPPVHRPSERSAGKVPPPQSTPTPRIGLTSLAARATCSLLPGSYLTKFEPMLNTTFQPRLPQAMKTTWCRSGTNANIAKFKGNQMVHIVRTVRTYSARTWPALN